MRLQVLETAIELNDWIFLFLHHIISQQFLDPGFIPPTIAAIPNFPEAANIMNHILGSHQLQGGGTLAFFAAFPCQLGLALSFNQTTQDGLMFLSRFIPHLRLLWGNLQHECRQRQYPPTISELAAYLKVLSPTFMKVFFTAARRWAWPCTAEQEKGLIMTQICQEADNIFDKAREAFLFHSHNYQPNAEAQEYLRLQRSYLSLIQFQMQGHTQSPVQGMRGGGNTAPRQVCCPYQEPLKVSRNFALQNKIMEFFVKLCRVPRNSLILKLSSIPPRDRTFM